MKVKPGVVITPTMWASRRLGQKECDDFKVRQGYIGRPCLNRTRKRKAYETLRYGTVAGSRVWKSLGLKLTSTEERNRAAGNESRCSS